MFGDLPQKLTKTAVPQRAPDFAADEETVTFFTDGAIQNFSPGKDRFPRPAAAFQNEVAVFVVKEG